MLWLGLFSGFGHAQNHKCLTDGLAQQMAQQYPQGAPGLIPPSQKTLDDPEFTYVIPVVFHIMANGGPELGVTPEQIQSQIDVMNEDFGRYGNGFNTHPDGINVKIRFCLASIDPDGNPTSGIDTVLYTNTGAHDPFQDGVDLAMKSLAIWEPNHYLNFYIVRQILNGQTAGYSYFPGEAAGTDFDGIVADFRVVGRGTGTAVTLGHTGSHEAGHYLDLYHPWGLTDTLCGGLGDRCDDTPEVPIAWFAQAPGCNQPPTCEGTVLRQIENFMDYSEDPCLNMFTVCQGERMRKAVLRHRGELVSKSNLARTGCSAELDNAITSDQFVIFPNPADDVLMVIADFDTDAPVTIEMYDFAGRRVRLIEPSGMGRGAFPIDVSTMLAGSYHLVVRLDNQYIRRTVLVGR